jgi:hypothetical protein
MMPNTHTERVTGATAARTALEARLDAALAESFPASDPVAITICAPAVGEDRRARA